MMASVSSRGSERLRRIALVARTSATVGSEGGEFGGVLKGFMDWTLEEIAVRKLGSAMRFVQRKNVRCSS